MGAPQAVVSLRDGVRAVWDAAKAHRETTPTRERLSINGLWRWQPAGGDAGAPPSGEWGYFKVPGCWPGITDYLQKDSQIVHAHPLWQGRELGRLTAAWYEREITIPAEWSGRRIVIEADTVNSFAAVHVDGKKVGEIRFPEGEVDLSGACLPGSTHLLSLLVIAMPLEAVRLSYSDTAAAREVKGAVRRRGLCGDVYLASSPPGARIRDVKVDTSVRRWQVTLDVGLDGLAAEAGRSYRLSAEVLDDAGTVKELRSRSFTAGDLEAGRFRLTEAWQPERLWDVHTPRNLYRVAVSLLDDDGDGDGRRLDTYYPVRLGFRELWINGRDFYLNGTRIFLSAVPLDNAEVGASLACYAGARESLERLKSLGINLVYTHNYDCEPGSHLSFEEVLSAADDVGMLVSLSQPHFSNYRWESDRDDAENGYASHAAHYVRVAQSHPSVVMYAMSHNATGYNEDMDPDKIDGIYQPRDTWSLNNARRALRAEAIVRRLDPSRIVYHHSSGNLSSMHTSNFYANFVPAQELCDWFEGWANRGVKPVFLCEYGAPLSWDWTMYRGWYRGEREFGSASVPWELCIAEWNAQFVGDRAYRLSEAEKRDLRWEAQQFRAGRTWHLWDYPLPVDSSAFEERQPIYAAYFTDVWRAFRTWGVSAICPWDHGHYWTLREGAARRPVDFDVDWDHLQRPGFSPDRVAEPYERVDLGFERSDWRPTAAAEAFLRANGPLLAYIGGKPARFTSKDHDFRAGETVEKQLIVINNSRETVTADFAWSIALPRAVSQGQELSLATGEQARVPLRFELPPTLSPGAYELQTRVTFGGGASQQDAFTIHVLPPVLAPASAGGLALFDPRGETGALLRRLGVAARTVDAGADLSPFRILIIGKGALTEDGPGLDICRVRDGLKVIVFEQTAATLERRLGFRVAEYGLRRVFPRVADHPLLAGLAEESLRDWRGEATILPPRIAPEMRPRHGPTVRWCDIPVTRAWRCGSYGNVASVLIEKPGRGDFLPILDGGFSLQYSPLLEHREGRGVVLFCQMDVTGRTESDPAAEALARNILAYIETWTPGPQRLAVYAGEPAGKDLLAAAGVAAGAFADGKLSSDQVLIAGPASVRELAAHRSAVARWLEEGGRVLAIGLDAQEANDFLPFEVRTRVEEHIATHFEPQAASSPFAGIGPADVHNRDPRQLPLVTGGVAALGDGVVASAAEARVVFLQMVPWSFDMKQQNTKRVFRRTAFALSRLLGNLGVSGSTPLLERFREPVHLGGDGKRWLDGLYLDAPEEWDDPYRFFRW